MRVGITAVGSGIGHAIVQSCRMASLPLYLVGFDSNPLAFDAFDCSESHVVPRTSDPDYLENLLRLCAERRIDLLIPGLDADLTILAAHAARFRAIGTTAVVGGTEFVRLCRDKLAWSRELNPVCPAIVPSWTAAEVAALHRAGQLAFPLLAKPTSGSGSASIAVLSSPGELASLSADVVVQPVVLPSPHDPVASAVHDAIRRGEVLQAGEISFQLLFAKNGELLGRMATRNRLKQGVPVEVSPVDDEPFWDALRPAIDHLRERGLRGPVNFQGRVTEAGPRFFEMNGRFTGITAVRAMLGFNEVEALLEDCLDLPPARRRILKVNRRRVGLRQVVDRIVDLSALEHSPAPEAANCAGLAIVLTGANGWLGRHLVNALLGHRAVRELTALVRDPALAHGLWPASKRLTIARATDPSAVMAAVAGADLVYHLAFALAGRPHAEVAASLAFTRNLLSAARRVYLPRLVVVSSQSVYGFTHPPRWTEDLSPAPETAYGMAKLAAEELTGLLKESSPSSRITCIRLARLYGAAQGLRWTEVPHLFAARSVRGEPIVVRGPDQLLDLLHIRDAVAALLRFTADEPREWCSIYNVGNGAPVHLLEVAERALDAARRLGRCPGEVRLERLDGVPRSFGLDIERFSKALRWVPAVGLAQAMEELASLALNESQASASPE